MRMLSPAIFLFALSSFSAPASADERRVLRAEAPARDDLREQYAKKARHHQASSMAHLKELIARTDPGPVRAEMLLRLAEMYFDEARYQRLVAEDEAASAEQMAAAARLYELIVTRYPDFARIDEAAFYLASAREELGEVDAALAAWVQFVRGYPDSAFVFDAYVQVGEHYFSRGEVFKALQAYEAAAKGPSSTMVDYAQLQSAWCYYNLGEYGKALNGAARLVADAGPMRDEALSALGRFSAEHYASTEALTPLARLPLTDTERLTLSDGIATILREMGAAQDAAVIWSRLLTAHPDADGAPGWLSAIVDIHLRRADHAAAMAVLDSSTARRLPEAREEKLRAVAVDAHTEARKRRQPALFTAAGAAYAAWLADYAETDGALEVRYAYGELLYDTQQFESAYEQYRQVAASDSEHAAFCAEAAVHAAEALLRDAEPPAPSGTARISLTPAAERYVAAADVLLAREIPAATRQPVLYRVAYLLYRHNHLPEAATRFEVVIASDPTTTEAEQAAHLIMDALALQEQWAPLRDVARRFRDLDGLGGPRFATETQEIYEGAAFKVISGDALHDPAGAAAAWVGFASAHPDSALAAQSLNNAAVSYHQARLRADAIAAREALLERYPDSSFAPAQMAALGFDRESIADFEAAADWYERLFAEHPDHPSAADALLSASVFRRSLGQADAAIRDGLAFAERFSDDPRAAGVLLDVGALHADAGATREALTLYQRYAEQPPAGATVIQQRYARLSAGQLLASQGRADAAAAAWAQILTEANGDTDAVVAEARYRLAEQQREQFWALQLDRQDRIGRQTRQMTGALKTLEGAYMAVISDGELRWGLAAATQLGASYERLAAQLRQSPRPSLTPAQLEMYEDQIEDLAWTMEQKASALYSEALTQSFAQHFYDESTATALGRLQELDPNAYPALTEEIIRTAFTAGGGPSGVGLMESPE